MLALVFGGSLVLGPPTLPQEVEAEPAAVEPAAPVGELIPVAVDPEAGVEAGPVAAEAAPVAAEAAPVVVDAGASTEAFVISPAPASAAPAPVGAAPQPSLAPAVVVGVAPPAPAGPRMQMTPAPPWSGSGRFVGGSVFLIAGAGLLVAATMEFADRRDTTAPLISNVPAGVVMLVGGGLMLGTAARDQHRLAEWEAATRVHAPPSGNGLIVGGVTASALGVMSAVATSIAVDYGLDAPRSIPAGWATAGLGLGAGTGMLIAGIVRRSRYGAWRDRTVGMPMVAPTRAGASLSLSGRF
ncbi:hypothetical protein G6O69_34790 [Pseudenhygromyxa sp. WMMC2535]|uniref:hypothetical protein n=1 Tax=Pseudenhygromyxa sp. WMMC2535 TaxID=2712867 RepID=UPI0015516CAC|nr:hypothetical protein [Pseudenhygromyxa sp. WMMC2535]NVB43042.1 hypothetical protein [Pseudenhygromyxa sp. WMMC2535]